MLHPDKLDTAGIFNWQILVHMLVRVIYLFPLVQLVNLKCELFINEDENTIFQDIWTEKFVFIRPLSSYSLKNTDLIMN